MSGQEKGFLVFGQNIYFLLNIISNCHDNLKYNVNIEQISKNFQIFGKANNCYIFN